MNKHSVFIIDESPLIEAISKYGKGYDSKDYEYAVSIYMKRKLEQIYKEPFCIVFDLNNKGADSRKVFKPTPEETIKILREKILEDTPVDFGLVRGTVSNPSKEAFAFQVKKFLVKSVKDIDNVNHDLLEYINKVLARYRAGETSLIIIPSVEPIDGVVSDLPKLDIKMLRDKVTVPENSFKGVYIMVYNQKVNVKQLWPPLDH